MNQTSHPELTSTNQLVLDYEASPTMQAVGLTRQPAVGHVVENLEMLTVPTPRPGPDDVAIKVVASSMHIDEIYAAQGTALGRFYAPKHVSTGRPHIMGSAVSGIVVGIGNSVDRFQPGDEVMVIPAHEPESGSWATYRCVDQKMVMTKPSSITHEQAVATTMGACVAWGAIEMSGVKRGDHCIVVGASGSIGSMMTGYLSSLGCTVMAVGGGQESELMRRNGADDVVDYHTMNFADRALETGQVVDAVFDCVGGRDIEHDGFRALSDRGVYVTVVGPKKYLGETKLSRTEAARAIGYVLRRIVTTRLRAKRYIFGEKIPRKVIDEALAHTISHDIHMPVASVIPCDLDAINTAVRSIVEHRAKGRIVIGFSP